MADTSAEDLKRLRGIFLLRGLNDGQADEALRSGGCSVRIFSSGEVICSPEDTCRALCVLLSGRARVTGNDAGSHRVLLRELREGDIVGAASLFGGDGGYVTTVTAKGTVRAAFLSQSLCTEIITSCPEAALSYIRFLSDKIRFLNDRIGAFTVSAADRRVAQYLLRTDSGNEGKKAVPMKSLASSLNIGRATLYRVLDRFSAAGWIAKDGAGMTVLDRKALCGVLSGEPRDAEPSGHPEISHGSEGDPMKGLN